MARPQVADGGKAPIWRIAANISIKQSRTADKEWSSSVGVGRGANNFSPLKRILLRKTKPRTWTDTFGTTSAKIGIGGGHL
jgi:hypothetical protein